MRIGFDGKVISSLSGGIGTSALNLVRSCVHEAAKRYPQLEFVIFTGPHTCLDGIQGSNWRIDERFCRVDSSLLRLLLYIPRGLRSQRIDIFHGLDHIGVPLVAKVGRYVATIHDMIPLIWPRLVTRKHRLVVTAAYHRLRDQADLVIAPSEATKVDIMHYLQITLRRGTAEVSPANSIPAVCGDAGATQKPDHAAPRLRPAPCRTVWRRLKAGRRWENGLALR
jgi:glycosyltransferase involved in cell wall biosynthesis